MKKILVYSLIGLVIGLIMLYFTDNLNYLFGNLLAGAGLGSADRLRELRQQANELQQDADKLKEERENLEVEDKTGQEEKDYWENE